MIDLPGAPSFLPSGSGRAWLPAPSVWRWTSPASSPRSTLSRDIPVLQAEMCTPFHTIFLILSMSLKIHPCLNRYASYTIWHLEGNVQTWCWCTYQLPEVSQSLSSYDVIRETRDGWPLLTVETEVNGDSKSKNERGPFLFGSLGLSCRGKRDNCSALAALIG